GIKQAEGFLHVFEGWVIFGLCIVILFLLALALQRLTPHPKRLSEVLDLDTDGFAVQARRLLSIAPARGLVIAALITLVISAVFVLTPARQQIEVQRDSFSLFPRQVGDWSGSMASLDPHIAEVLSASDYVDATYTTANESAPVNFFSAWYLKQTEGTGIHSPAVCLPVGGWEVSNIEATPVSMPGTVYGDFNVNRAIIQKGVTRELVYYWFEERGKRTTSDYAAKFGVVLDSLVRGRSDGALVRFVTPISPGESEAEADARMQRFMAALLPKLPRFIPE
ncbi:MAG: exosortase C-terminal domain/associated protein EpsI, partial [Paracoccaceae bacterium]